MCLRVSYKKKLCFGGASLKTLKKGVRSGVRSVSGSQRYGSADPDPHKDVADPQQWTKEMETARLLQLEILFSLAST
jgi:hypothetical protein